MSLDAYFIGIIQVLVYAGAVMVLFLFIIMLLDLRAEERRKINIVAVAGGAAVSLALFSRKFVCVVGKLRGADTNLPRAPGHATSTTSATSACSFSTTTTCRSRSSACSSSSRPSA